MARNDVANFHRLRLTPIDLGVALLMIVALAFGLLLRGQVADRLATFQSPDAPLQLSYPADWREAGTLQDVLLNVEDSFVESPFKTTFTVQSQDLDPAAPPSLEELTNRRIDDRSALVGYHFLSSGPTEVAGNAATLIEYAYVAQPIDEPRRPSLPVVVTARDYVVVKGASSYYFSIAAPESDGEQALATMEQVMRSVQIQ